MSIEESKNRLIQKYIKNPDYFWHETDMHCFLWNELIKEKNCIFSESKNSEICLVRREYPTNLFYDTSDKNKIYNPIKPTQWKQHGKFDLAIIQNPNETNSYGFNKITHAFELKFEAERTGKRTVDTKKHFFMNIFKDYRKLTDKENEVDRGHLLYFTKNENTGFQILNDIINYLDKENKKFETSIDINLEDIKFEYVEINENKNPIIIRNY